MNKINIGLQYSVQFVYNVKHNRYASGNLFV